MILHASRHRESPWVEKGRARIHLPPMRMVPTGPDLFPAALPPGLEYRPDFLDPEDERALLATFAALPFREAAYRQYTARRRVVRFGRDDDDGARGLQHGGPLPEWLAALRARAAEVAAVDTDAFVHALVTEYRPGTPIGWHRDSPEYGTVVGISLASACRMCFRPYEGRSPRREAESRIVVELAPRSLYVMRGDVRWGWQHHIPAVKALRYSVTFRTRVRDASGA